MRRWAALATDELPTMIDYHCEVCGTGLPLHVLHDCIKEKGERLNPLFYGPHVFCDEHNRFSLLYSPYNASTQIGYIDEFGRNVIYPWFSDLIDDWDDVM